MTQFDTMFGPALELMLANQGTTVSYDGTPFTALVGPESAETETVEGERQRIRQRSIAFRETDVPAPARGKLIDLDGEVWTVENRQKANGGFVRVLALRIERGEAGGRSTGH